MYPNPDHVGGIPGMLYLLLDPGKFKKHIELTYAAVTASKNECNCIFFRFLFLTRGLAAATKCISESIGVRSVVAFRVAEY